MSVITKSACEPAADAFAGFCCTERQRRELRRIQLLVLHNVQKPVLQSERSGAGDHTTQAVPPSSPSQLPSRTPAAAFCDFQEADAVHLERQISSIDASSENGRYLLLKEISTACSKIIRVPSENVVDGEFGFECACLSAAALDSDMSPGQRQWFPKIANKRIVKLLLHILRSSQTDETRALACSSLEHIAFFESGRYMITSEDFVPVLLHMATRICEETAVVALLRIFPALCVGVRTKAVREAFVSLGCSALRYGCHHLELYFVAFRLLTFLSRTERELINDENRTRMFNDAGAFLTCQSLASVFIRAAQLENLSNRTLNSMCNAFLKFTGTKKGIKFLSNDTALSVFLRILMKVDDFETCFNMTCNVANLLPYWPTSRHPEVLQAMGRCSVVAPYQKHPQQDSNYFNINILSILKMIAADYFDPILHIDDPLDSIDDLQQSLLSIFRPFAVTLLRMAASTDAWAIIQEQDEEENFVVYDKHHALNCKMVVLHTASEIVFSFQKQLETEFSAASLKSACAHLLKLQCSSDEIGSTNSEFQSIESLLLSCLANGNMMFRDRGYLRHDHLKDDPLGLHLFRLLHLRSILHFNDDVNLELNNRLIFTTLSHLKYPRNVPSPKEAITVDLILEIVFSSRKFDAFFAQNITSVDCKTFHTISRLFSFLSQKVQLENPKTEPVAERKKNPWMLATQCSVFKSLIDILILTYSHNCCSGKDQFETDVQLPTNHAPPPPQPQPQLIFSRVRIVNWNGSELVVSFNQDAALSELVASACEAFKHQPGTFDIVCAHSRTAFTPAEFGVSLSQIGIVPSGKVYLQERNSAHLAEIKIVDLLGNSSLVHFEVTATLNDIACLVRDRRYKGYPKKSFSIVVNGKSVFQESSFAAVSLLKAGLLPSGSVSFQDMKGCEIGSLCETCIKDFLCFANTIITADSPLFNSGTAKSMISLLKCSLCYDAQMGVISSLMVLFPTCNEDDIASIRHVLFERIDELSKVNIRCQCHTLWYDEFFHRVKDVYGHKLLSCLVKLRALPNAINDADFFEMVDRIVVSRTHLHRNTLWVHRYPDDCSMEFTSALAELFTDNVQDLIESLSQTSPQSPRFLRILSKILTILLTKRQDEKPVGMSPDLIRTYTSAIRNARDAPSRCCPDAALIVAYIFSVHLKNERTKSIKSSKWNVLKEHFHVVCDICTTSGAVLPPMLRVFTAFVETSCSWFGPSNLMQKRDLNAELGEARLNSVVAAALQMSSHPNYLFLDSAACFFKVIARNAQLSQRLTLEVPGAILTMLENYKTFCVKYMAQCTAHADKSEWQHVLQAFHAIVPLSHLEAAVLKPSNLEVLSRFYSHSEVMDIFHDIQKIPFGRQMIGASLHTIAAVLNALNKGDGKVQSKAIKVLAAGLQAPASLVWRQAPGLKETLDHLVNLASNFFVVGGKKITAYKTLVDESHILFSSHFDLILLLESLICCSSKVLSVSGPHVEMASEAVFDIRDLMVFTFDLLRNGETLTSDMKTCDDEIMYSLMRALKSTPPSLVSEHILNHFDDNACSVPTWLLCALNAMASDVSCVQPLCSNEMMACFLKVGRNPVVSSTLELALTQEANENFLHLESLRSEFDWDDFSEQPKKRARKSFTEYKTECLKYEALEQQRLNGLAHSRSLYQLIARITGYRQDIFAKEDFLRMLLDAVRPGTNLNAMDDILVAIRQIFGQQCRYDTHAVFNAATFSKLRRFLFVVLGQIHTISVRIDASQYAKKVKKTLWSDLCAVLGSYLTLLLQIYPFRAFRRALTATNMHSSHLGGKSIIAVIVHILESGTKTTSYALRAANPFKLFSRMLFSPVMSVFVANLFPEIVKLVMDDQSLHQKKFFKKKQKTLRSSYGGFVGLHRYSSEVPSSMVAFMATFTKTCPRIALEQASQISSVGVFACRMASYFEPRIIQETCGFVQQLLRTPFSGVVCESFASASFADLAALCDFSLLPSQQELNELFSVEEMTLHEKFAVLELIREVASFGSISSDSMTLALLRLIWGCSSHEDINDIAPPAQRLLIDMGVTKDNFIHVLPQYSKPIAAGTPCYMEDLCVADEGEAFFQLACGHAGHSYCLLGPVFTSGKCPKCRRMCVFEVCERDSSLSESGDES